MHRPLRTTNSPASVCPLHCIEVLSFVLQLALLFFFFFFSAEMGKDQLSEFVEALTSLFDKDADGTIFFSFLFFATNNVDLSTLLCSFIILLVFSCHANCHMLPTSSLIWSSKKQSLILEWSHSDSIYTNMIRFLAQLARPTITTGPANLTGVRIEPSREDLFTWLDPFTYPFIYLFFDHGSMWPSPHYDQRHSHTRTQESESETLHPQALK